MTTLKTPRHADMMATANLTGRLLARGLEDFNGARNVMASIALDCIDCGYGTAAIAEAAIEYGNGIMEVMAETAAMVARGND